MSDAMLWVGVPVGNHPAELIVAAAAVQLLEYHDVALTAGRSGQVFDPIGEGVDTIYGSYALRRRLGDARRPYWLCAATHVSRDDVAAARVSLGAFARDIEPVDADISPCIYQGSQLSPGLIEAFADEIGVVLPDDAHARLRRLITKHMPESTAPPRRAAAALASTYAERFARVMTIGQISYERLKGAGMDTESSDSDDEDEARVARRAAKRRRLQEVHRV